MIDRETLRDIIKGAFIGLAVAPFAYLFIVGMLLIGG